METAVELTEVTKRFANVPAVDAISLAVNTGEIVSLLGPSGCGKTTTLRIIAGFESPDSGIVRIAGEDMARMRPYQRNVGLLFQNYALFPHMTVAGNVGYGLRYRGFKREEAARRVEEMLALVKLKGLSSRFPNQLSGGQQQRVALARSLATRPRVLLLDEPLSALDASLRQELRIELKEILASAGTTALVVTHDQEEAMSLATRIFVMRAGRIEQQGTPKEIYNQPRTPFVAEFIGRSNWLRARSLRTLGHDLCEAMTDAGMLRIRCSPDTTEVDICIRPERLAVIRDTGVSLSGLNRIAGRLVDVAYLGADLHLVVEIGGGRRILVIEPNHDQPLAARGGPITVGFLPEECLVFRVERQPIPIMKVDGFVGR